MPGKIIAVIPSSEQPPMVVTDSKQRLPEVDLGIGETVEHALMRLGKLVAGLTVTVNYALSPLDGARVLQAKPIPDSTELSSGYLWSSSIPGSIKLKG